MAGEYSKHYREKYDKYFKAKSLNGEKAKAEKQLDERIRIRVKKEKGIGTALKEAEEKIGEESKKALQYIKEPRHIKILKILVILIPFLIFGYLIYVNFIISQEFNYFYDIGSVQDAKKPYLSPLNRISDPANESDISYRNLISGLVYFNIPIPRGAEKITIQTSFKDNSQEKNYMSLGAKDQDIWHYNYNLIYNSILDELISSDVENGVYLVNPDSAFLNLEELQNTKDIVVATDGSYSPIQNKIEDYEAKETIINNSLRGSHVFYIYAKEDLKLEVKKQDLNWYEGSDELDISIYDLDNNLIISTTIPDDGITEVSKEIAKIQSGELTVNNLKEGVYRLEFSDFDGFIREIKVNTNKIVSSKLFLADNSIYNINTKPSEIYTELSRKNELTFLTYHDSAKQNIKINEKNYYVNQRIVPVYADLSKGKYSFIVPKNDLIVSSTGYFAFLKENYFEPFSQRVAPLTNDVEWIKNNVDYIVANNYNSPIKDKDWLIAETKFDIKQDKLFVKDNQLSMVYNIPNLNPEENPNNAVAVDWINITVYKPGLFDKNK